MQNLKSILIIMAMAQEADPIIKKLGLKSMGLLRPDLPMLLYKATQDETTINLVLNGCCNRFFVDYVGTQASTLTAQIGIDLLSPNLIINAGTAGGFLTDNAKVGDIYLGHPYVCFHDRRINIPNFAEYGVGRYPCIPCKDIANDLGLRTGVVSTGNSLDFTQKDLEIIRSYNGVVKDMEAAAIAWVAQLNGIDFMAIKAITDIVDGDKPTEVEFLENLKHASHRLCHETSRVIDCLLSQRE